MEEENKTVVEPEVVEASVPQEGNPEADKNALIAFILSVAGLAVCAGWIIGGIACVILGGISRRYAKLGEGSTRKPHKVFEKIAKIVGVVDIPLGIIVAIIYLVVFIITIAGIIAAAAEGAVA